MRRAVIDDPENAISGSIRLLFHHLGDEFSERLDAGRRLATAKHLCAMNIERGHVRECSHAFVFMLDTTGLMGPRRGPWMNSFAGLNACLFVGRDHEVILGKWFVVPGPGIQVEHAPRFLFELRISGKDPTAMTPWPECVLGQPSPEGRFTDGGDQSSIDRCSLQIRDLEARDRKT